MSVLSEESVHSGPLTGKPGVISESKHMMLTGLEIVTEIFLKLFIRNKKLRGMRKAVLFSPLGGQSLKEGLKVQFKFLKSSWLR